MLTGEAFDNATQAAFAAKKFKSYRMVSTKVETEKFIRLQ